jgi:hypothetical protein
MPCPLSRRIFRDHCRVGGRDDDRRGHAQIVIALYHHLLGGVQREIGGDQAQHLGTVRVEQVRQAPANYQRRSSELLGRRSGTCGALAIGQAGSLKQNQVAGRERSLGQLHAMNRVRPKVRAGFWQPVARGRLAQFP